MFVLLPLGSLSPIRYADHGKGETEALRLASWQLWPEQLPNETILPSFLKGSLPLRQWALSAQTRRRKKTGTIQRGSIVLQQMTHMGNASPRVTALFPSMLFLVTHRG